MLGIGLIDKELVIIEVLGPSEFSLRKVISELSKYKLTHVSQLIHEYLITHKIGAKKSSIRICEVITFM
jgi:hypothetical protein